ncbi:facilitated trehalose transporter Tret1-like [Lycorma delicatula]|uniref:facilitated trehalose transporter Tret1-like n=1 Tax=Lycorma delicatula TaxID=130591 RepID=UPI003F512BAC
MAQTTRQRSRRNLYLAAFAANLSFTSCGCCMAWTSPTLPKLKLAESWLVIDDAQGSWIGSLIAIGGLCGPLLASRLLDLIGRKWTLICDVVLLLFSWAIVALRINFYILLFGRFLSGIAVGIIFMALPVYIAEISDVETRGSLGSLNELFIAAGFFFEYLVGTPASYLQLIAASAIIPILFLIIFYHMPDSPHYLMAKGRKDEAIDAIKWLRMYQYDNAAEKESQDIQGLLDDTKNQQSNVFELFRVKGNRRALLIVFGLIFFQQFTGINVIQFYTQSIFDKAGDNLPKGIAPIMVGLTQFMSSLVTPFVARKWGLKIPLLVSALGTAASQGVLGIYFYMDSSGTEIAPIVKFIPLISLVLFTFFFCLGLGPLPWAVVGEMFPANVKALSSSLASSFCFTLTFIITKFFTNVSDELGTHTAFWVFSACCFVGLIFIALTIPDTRGMTLQDIQDVMNGRVRRSMSVQMVNANRRVTETGSMIQMIMRSGILVEQPEATITRNLLANDEYSTVMITEHKC